jgi:hypothetical protein
MCPHTPPCPDASGPDREAARTIISHPEQGWSLLCNGIVVFEDTGELLPDGETIAPHRPTDLICQVRSVKPQDVPAKAPTAKTAPAKTSHSPAA